MVDPMSGLRRQANRASDWLVRAVLLGRQFDGRWKLDKRAAGSISRAPPGECWPTERHHRPSRRCNHGPYQFGALPLQLRREPHASRHVDEKSIRRGRPPKDHTAEERLAAERQRKEAWVRARRHAEGDGREPAGAATPPEGTVEGQQRSPQVTWLVMGRLHGGEAGSA